MNRSTGKRKAAKSKAVSLAIGATLLAGTSGANALGFGRLPTTATLGHPLDIAIPIRLDANEDLSSECIKADVHFGDNRQQNGVVNLRLDQALPGASDRVLRITTNTRVDEPFVSVDVTAGCIGKVSRNFTLLADPPLLVAEAPVAVEPPPVAAAPAPVRAAAPAPQRAPAAATSAAQVAEGTPAPRRSPKTPRKAAPVASVGAAPAPRATPAPKPSATNQQVAAANPERLSLTPLEQGARVDAPAAAASAAEAASAASAVVEAASAVEAAASARERVEQLEAALAKLRSETTQAQQNVQGMQARLQSAEQSRYSNPLVYALGAAGLLLAGALFWLWRQREAERQQHAWLVSSHARDSGSGADVDTEEAIAFAPHDRPTTQAGAFISAPTPLSPPSTGPGSFDPLSTVVLRGPSAGLQAQPAKREVSAEELIDLEQQAEFFMVLGQEEAAIDLLMGHLRSTAGTSPLPYLKLLEIYKKRGERKEYERTRERFNSRFNAYAPSWETDLLEGRSLEDYPSVLEQITELWPRPERVLDTLQATLVRPDGESDAGGDSFDLPAYRELMLLYAVARDHTENPVADEPRDEAVDLLLPLDDMPVLERLMSTTPVTAQPAARQPLHIDVPLELDAPASDFGKLTLEFPPTQVEDDPPKSS